MGDILGTGRFNFLQQLVFSQQVCQMLLTILFHFQEKKPCSALIMFHF